MKTPSMSARRRRRRGFLTLEWILLLTILVIGIVGGIALVRDAVLDELKDMSHAVRALTMFEDCEDDQQSGPDVCPPGNPGCVLLP